MAVSALADPAHAEDAPGRCAASCARCRRGARPGRPAPGETSSRPRGPGSRAGALGQRCWGSGGSGSRSKRTPSSSAPDTPSMVLWCILATRAILPSFQPLDDPHLPQGAVAVELAAGHVGRRSRPARACRPGEGSAARRRWLSMSNSGSSTQTGWPSRNGTSTSRRWKTGEQGDALVDELADPPERVPARHRRGVEDGGHGHVHVEGRRLHIEETGIEPGQPFGGHRLSLVIAP